jgi:hypothetical protein
MFAGLPGIGVGTLFYILAALWMPVGEIGRLVQGTSSVERWRRIGVQRIFAFSIIGSIVIADRVLLWVFGEAAPSSVSPARWLNEDLAVRAPQSILAAPIMASVLLLALVLLVVELCHWFQRMRRRMFPPNAETGFPDRLGEPSVSE